MRSLIVIFLFAAGTLQAQQPLTWSRADSLTYAYFISKQYDKVQSTGKAALSNGIDFYYLRMRMGIAYYEEHHYEQAIAHFEKAHAMNPADTLPEEYLYYSYLFSGRTENADAFAANASATLREKITQHRGNLRSVSLGIGMAATGNISAHQNEDINGRNYYMADGSLNGNVYAGSFALQHTLRNRFNWYNGFSLFRSDALGRVQLNNENVTQQFSNRYFQLNSALTWQSQNGWMLGGGLGLYSTSTSTLKANPDTNNTRFRYITLNDRFLNFSGSFSIGKRIGNVVPSLTLHAANLGNGSQLEGEAALLWYPFGNTRFYTRTMYAGLQNSGTFQTIFTQQVGGRITDKLWYEAGASFGNLNQYITNYGFLTYNTADPVKINAGADLRFCFRKLEVVPGYHFQLREGSYQQYKTPNDFTTTRFNYSAHFLTTTIKWRF
jgi:hypothetical protein